MIWESLDPGRILMDLEAEGRDEALAAVAGLLTARGDCRPSFAEAIVKREAEYPTGLDMGGGIGVAIPHTDPSHVLAGGLAAAVLKKPVQFTQMGTDDELVEVKLIFCLAIDNPKAHLDKVEALLEVLRDQAALKRLASAKSAEEVISIIRDKEGEMSSTQAVQEVET
jgi:PTS system galactitol-specific IIA component